MVSEVIQTDSPSPAEGKRYAPIPAPLRLVVWFGVGLLLVVIVIYVVIAFYYVGLLRHFRSADKPGFFDGGQPPPPPPRLQIDPEAELAAMRRHEAAVLESYGWVDRHHGVVRIPIDEAMKLYLQRQERSATKGEGQ